MPGNLDRFLGRSRLARCPICHGADTLSLGFISHQPDCPRSPCQFCSLEVMPGEKRTIYHGRTAHEDCRIAYLEHLDTEHEETREAKRRA